MVIITSNPQQAYCDSKSSETGRQKAMCGTHGDSGRVRLLLLTLRVVPSGRTEITTRSMFTSPVASKLDPNQIEPLRRLSITFFKI